LSKLVGPAEAVARIADGAVVTVSSSSALGCPDLVLKALGERFDAEGRPRGLTALHPIAAGDMYGVKGMDHIAKDGLLTRIIAGSYPSGPSSLPMPEIWKMIVEDRVAAYNVPSGIMFDMHREAAARRPGVLTRIGFDTFADPIREGCAMNAKAAAAPIVARVEFAGETWLHFPNIAPEVCILRATTADERGNLTYEHEGAYLGGLEQAIATRNHGGLVIAQVKRVTASGSLRPTMCGCPVISSI
jgi:propionate CoA-transferase